MSVRVLAVYGTRPEAIKLWPVVRELRGRSAFALALCSTGQHQELLAPTETLLKLQPSVRLQMMREIDTPGESLARLIAALCPIVRSSNADWVLVQGDTTTTLASAMAAHYARIPVAHLEAGLRSEDQYRPFPEELHRRMVDHASSLHLAPTARAAAQLVREGLSPRGIHVTGNSGIDAVRLISEQLEAGSLSHAATTAARLCPPSFQDRVLLTTHRRENMGSHLAATMAAVRAFASGHPRVGWIYPLHPHPGIAAAARSLRGLPNVFVIPPLDYAELVATLRSVSAVVTDSGGLQEEAPYLGVPVIVLRSETERPEPLESGHSRLANPQALEDALLDVLGGGRLGSCLAHGDGHAAAKVARALETASAALDDARVRTIGPPSQSPRDSQAHDETKAHHAT